MHPKDGKTSQRVYDIDGLGGGMIFWGLIYCLAFAAVMVVGHDRMSPFMLIFVGGSIISGFGLTVVGWCVLKRWRYSLLLASPVLIIGLLGFPTGTAISGYAIFLLWKQRHVFYPFKA